MTSIVANLLSSVLGSSEDAKSSGGSSGVADLFGQAVRLAAAPEAEASSEAGSSRPLVASQAGGGSSGPLAEVAITDRDGDGIYTRGDINKMNSVPETARAIVAQVGADPKVKATFLGEVHNEQSNRLFMETVKGAKAAGQNPVAAIEAPTTPVLDGMIEDLYAGKMSREDFVKKGAKEMLRAYDEAKTTMGPVPEDKKKDQLGLADFEHQLRQDVLRYHDQGIKVAFFDDARYQPGGNRDAAMADKLDRVIKDNPDSEVYVQAGLLHAQEDGRLPLLAGDGQGISKGVGTARIDGRDPAAERLAGKLGDDAVLTIGLDQYNQYTKQDGPEREGKPYITFIDRGLSDIDYARAGKDSGISHASFDYIVPTYDETRFDPFADQ